MPAVYSQPTYNPYSTPGGMSIYNPGAGGMSTISNGQVGAYTPYGGGSGAFTPYANQPSQNLYSPPPVYSAPKSVAQPVTKVATPAKTTTTAKTTGPAPLTAEQQQLNQQNSFINANYQPTLDFLSGLQSQYQGQLGQIPGQVQAQYAPYLQQAQQNQQQAQSVNQQQVADTQSGQQSALDQAKTLYGELQQNNRNVYGGDSSVGGAASEIQGRQLQQNVGGINQTTSQNLNQLYQQSQNIDQGYQQQVSQINAQTQSAIVAQQQQLQQTLNQIDQQTASIGSSKAEDKYNALQAFNQNKQAIQNQTTQYLQGLAQQSLSAQQQIYAAQQSYAAQYGQPVNLAGLPGGQYSSLLPTQVDNSGSQVLPGLVQKRLTQLGG